MALTFTAPLVQTPDTAHCQITKATPFADVIAETSTNLVLLKAGGADGTVIQEIEFQAAGDSTSTWVQIWLKDGANYRLKYTAEFIGTTISATALPAYLSILFDNWAVQAGKDIYVGIEAIDAPINVFMKEGGY